MTEFMKVSKDCGMSASGCFSSSPFYYYDGSKVADNRDSFQSSSYYQMYILADGTSIAFEDCGGFNARIYIDIDGPNKGKNQEGSDSFGFEILNNVLIPGPNDRSSGKFGEYDVTWWVIENGNMDYWKCADKLNWETQTSCK